MDDVDTAAYEALYDANVAAILGYAMRRVSDPADAADVVSETFLVAWRRRDELPATDASRLWLYGTARRVLANQRRGSLRRDRLADRLRSAIGSATSPDRTEEVGDGLAVRAAMSRLDADERELLELVHWEGLTPTEIATVTDLPPATVRTRLHRARARLRAELAASGFEVDRPPDSPMQTEPITDGVIARVRRGQDPGLGHAAVAAGHVRDDNHHPDAYPEEET